MPYKLVEPGILTVGVDASAPGALHSDPSAPGFEGFEVDLMMEVASRLGLTYRYRGGPWAGLIDELREGKLDAIVTAATITEERKRLVDFSEPYFEYRLGIAVRRHGAIRTLADLDGKKLAVRVATTAAQFVQTRAKAAEIRSYHTNVEAYEALRAGIVDAWVEDEPIAQWFVDRIPELELAGTTEATEARYAIMFRKGNDAVRRAVDQVLTSSGSAGAPDDGVRPGWLASVAGCPSELPRRQLFFPPRGREVQLGDLTIVALDADHGSLRYGLAHCLLADHALIGEDTGHLNCGHSGVIRIPPHLSLPLLRFPVLSLSRDQQPQSEPRRTLWEPREKRLPSSSRPRWRRPRLFSRS